MVAASPDQVFEALAAFADPPPFATIERQSERTGMGAIYQVAGRVYAIGFRHIFMIDVYDPPRSLAFCSVGRGGIRFNVGYKIEPDPAGASLTGAILVEGGLAWQLARPFLGRAVQAAADDAVRRAKRLAENPESLVVAPRPGV